MVPSRTPLEGLPQPQQSLAPGGQAATALSILRVSVEVDLVLILGPDWHSALGFCGGDE